MAQPLSDIKVLGYSAHILIQGSLTLKLHKTWDLLMCYGAIKPISAPPTNFEVRIDDTDII